MGLVKRVKIEIDPYESRGKELSGALFNQFNEWHSRDTRENKDLEEVLLKQRELQVENIGIVSKRPDGMVIFSPSGASKCARELYYKALGEKKKDEKFPYQRRWTRNSTVVHEATQRDLLYMTREMKNPAFTIKFLENGLPAWEENIKTAKIFKHKGVTFAVLGMMDGILDYRDGSTVGFEFKTKTNSVAQVGNYKMKAPAPYHLEQCTAYSLLFGMDEFILMYEAVAKDQWAKGREARTDIRTFYHRVDEKEKEQLLDKFAEVAKAVGDKEVPEMEIDKCIFCPYQYKCEKEKELTLIQEKGGD